MKPLVYSTSAAQDVMRAVDYLASIEATLAINFWSILDDELAFIRAYPSAFPEMDVTRHVRKMTFTKIPYSVYYVESRDRIMVIAILHHRQDIDHLIQKRT